LAVASGINGYRFKLTFSEPGKRVQRP
jgi:hypothetical protein